MGNERVLKTRLKLLALAVGMAWGGLVGAATLGDISILSGRGQPLQAEVELALSGDAEAGEVVTYAYTPEEYWSRSGLSVEASLRGLSTHLGKRPDGSYFLKVWSASAVESPQVALLIEVTSTANGKSVREYVFHLPTTVTAAIPDAQGAEHGETKSGQVEQTVEVKPGDNLNKIARAIKPETVSLERMLVALYRANPQAFMGKNMNRLKAGKVLRVPKADEIDKLEQREAKKELRAHVADWNAYRHKVAARLDSRTDNALEREASGKVEQSVSAKGEAGQAPAEVLRLSRGDAPGAREAAVEVKSLKDKVQSLEEDLTARNKALKESQDRIAMLEKNNREMQKLIELKSTLAPVSVPVKADEAVKAEVSAESAVLAASAVEAAAPEVASAPVVSEVAPKEPEPAPVVNEKASSVAKFLWGGAAALLAGGAAFYFLRRGRKEEKAKPVRRVVEETPKPAAPFPDDAELLVTSAIAQESAEAMVDVTSDETVRAAESEAEAVDASEEAVVQISSAASAAVAEEEMVTAPVLASEPVLDEPIYQAEPVTEALEQVTVLSEVVAPMESEDEPLATAEVKLDFDVPGFIPEMSTTSQVVEVSAEPELVLEDAFEAGRVEHSADSAPVIDLSEAFASTPEVVAELSPAQESAYIPPQPSEVAVAAAASPSESERMVAPEVVAEQSREALVDAAPAPVAEDAMAPELDIPTIADFTPTETSALPPMPGMEGVSLNFADEAVAAPEAAKVNGEQWLQVATKLDLARAYQEMGDDAGAREILEEVLVEGDAEQRATAEQLMQTIA